MDVTQPLTTEEIDAMPIEDIRQQFADILSGIISAYGDDRADDQAPARQEEEASDDV